MIEVYPPTRIGLWCQACALPSVVEFDCYFLKADGVTHAPFTVCMAEYDAEGA